MDMAGKSGNPQAGEAGHRERDRQPGKEKTPQKNPLDEGDAAKPKQAEGRSAEAREMQNRQVDRGDQLHPGPWRDEMEKSKGNVHHDQREMEPEMKEEEL